ncbi:AI-2E family transporter [Shewanella maritima]|uniref:AI-2E family transporter n=1 Tax=Shewanella maritima TaxID=2520507 RepID=UPI003735D763
MSDSKTQLTKAKFSEFAIEASIKVALIFLMILWCFNIIRPFIMPILWGAIIAITLYPVVLMLSKKLNLSVGKSSLIVTLIALAILIVPVVAFSGTLITGTTDFVAQVSEGTLVIPPPKESVAELPLIGEKLYQFWLGASSNLESLIQANSEKLKSMTSSLASMLGGFGLTFLQFIISIIIAGVFMKGAATSSEMSHKVAVRLAGKHGEDFQALTVATVRSVVQGVIGVAIIQSTLAGLGLVFVDVPGTAIWMLAVLLLAIVQLPPIIILGPLAAFVFTVESTTVATIFLVWSVLVSGSDAILKPVLMGRGVDIPMLVILLGAIGGMIMSGIVGLFVGAVVLALGYKLFIAWLEIDSMPLNTEDNNSGD